MGSHLATRRGTTSKTADRLRKAAGDVIETMERRLLFSTNVSGAITANTVWTTAGSPYILTAATYVRQGSNLSIQSGVVVQTSNSSQLFVSDDNTAASITASGVTFDAQLVTNTSAQGSIGGSVFNTAPVFNSTSPSSVAISGNTFNAGVDVHADYVSSLTGNTFKANSTVYVLGGSAITSSVTWGVIPNVSQYEIVAYGGGYNGRGVHVVSGGSLTLAPGVSVTTDGSNSYGTYDGIYVSEDSSGAALTANGSGGAIAISAPLYLYSTTAALLNNCQIGGSFYAATPGVGGIVISNTSFAQTPTFDAASVAGYSLGGDTFSQSVTIRPQMIPLVNGDTFSPGATLYVEGGGAINTSVAWSIIPNVAQYEIVAGSGSYNGRGVHVVSGATLTLAAGLKVTTDASNSYGTYDGIYVAEDSSGATLIANGSSAAISITAPLYIDSTSSATFNNCQIGNSFYAGSPGVGGIVITNSAFAQTPTFDAGSVSGYTLSGDTFSQSVSIRPQIIPLINGDTFAPNSTIYVLGGGAIGTSVSWLVVPDVAQYEIVAGSGSYNGRGVHVVSGATLTLAPGVKVTTDASNSYGTYDGIYVSEDSSGARLVANGSSAAIVITAPLYFDSTSSETIVNCQIGSGLYSATPGVGGITIANSSFAQQPEFDAASVAGYSLTGDIFSQSVSIRPQIVTLVNGDTFAPNSTIVVLGGGAISTSVTWSVIPNVAQYEIVAGSGSYNGRGVHVVSGATLTLAPGVQVTTDGSNSYGTYDGIYVAEDSSGARLVANAAAGSIYITAPLYLDSTSGATLNDCRLGGGVYSATPGAAGIAITGTAFAQTPTFDAGSTAGYTLTGDTFGQSVSIRPQIVPLVDTDIFGPGSTLYVLGGAAINTSITWADIPNVAQYDIVAGSGSYNGRGVHVVSGATLTIAPGVKIITDSSNSYGTYDDLYLNEDSSGAKLNAVGASFVLPVVEENNSGGLIEYCLFNQTLTVSGSSTAVITYNSLGTGGVVATGSAAQTINLANNWWGTTNASTIGGLITDHNDNSALPTINFTPVLTYDPTAAQAVSLAGSASYYLRMDADGLHTDVWTNATGIGAVSQQLLLSLVSSLSVAATGGAGSVTFDNSAGNVLPSGGTTVTGDGGTTLAVDGFIAGDTVTLNAGQLVDDNNSIAFTGVTQTTFNPDGGDDSVTVNAGKLTIPAPVAGSGVTVRQFTGISIAAGAELQVATAASHGDRSLIYTAGLNLAGTPGQWTGTLDLGGNDMDLAGGSLTTVSNQAAEGYNLGNWNSTGIESSAAAGDSRHLTALGVLVNNQGGPALFTSTSTFDTIIPAANDVLVKFTYYGDANFSGAVDASDYSLIDSGYASHLTGWYRGDFNYDGVVDGSDYALIDNAFNNQRTTLPSAQVAAVVAGSAGTTPKAGGPIVEKSAATSRVVRPQPIAGFVPPSLPTAARSSGANLPTFSDSLIADDLLQGLRSRGANAGLSMF